MKKTVRFGTFETNSSSTHSLTLSNAEDYQGWCDGNGTYLYNGSCWMTDHHYPGNIKPQMGHYYTFDEVKEFLLNSKYPPTSDFNWDDEEEVDELFRDEDFFSSDAYDARCEEFATFEETYVTPSGEKVIAFGYYGYNG